MRSVARLTFVAILFASAGALVPNASLNASGRTPPLPLPEEKFASHAACVAHLETQYAQDKATDQPHPVAAGSQKTRQTMVRSDGVRRIDGEMARYDVHIGYEIRVQLPDIRAIRTTYSYEEHTLICAGERLTGTTLFGHYQEGYAPLEGGAKSDKP